MGKSFHSIGMLPGRGGGYGSKKILCITLRTYGRDLEHPRFSRTYPMSPAEQQVVHRSTYVGRYDVGRSK